MPYARREMGQMNGTSDHRVIGVWKGVSLPSSARNTPKTTGCGKRGLPHPVVLCQVMLFGHKLHCVSLYVY